MIGIPKTDTLQKSVISGVCFEGLTITTKDGRPAYLAIVDAEGQIVESGNAVAKEAWNVTLAVYKNLLVGQGHLRIFSQPPGLNLNKDKAIAA